LPLCLCLAGDTFRRRVPAVIDLPLLFRAKLFALILANLVSALHGTQDMLCQMQSEHMRIRPGTSNPKTWSVLSVHAGQSCQRAPEQTRRPCQQCVCGVCSIRGSAFCISMPVPPWPDQLRQLTP